MIFLKKLLPILQNIGKINYNNMLKLVNNISRKQMKGEILWIQKEVNLWE